MLVNVNNGHSRSQAFDVKRTIAAIESVIGVDTRPVALHEPQFTGNELDYVRETIATGWVSSAGKYVDEFERRLAEVCDVPYAVATMNGTAALHVCLMAAGVTVGDEVLMPALTFVATANAISYCGAVPNFCDSDPDDLGIDPSKLTDYLNRTAEIVQGECRNRATGRRIAAIVPMHAFGHPSDMDALADVAARWNIKLIEDAAESLGSRYKGHPVGRHGLVTALSFNGNKIVTTGGGGAVLTHDPELARALKHLTTTAKRPHKWAFLHDQVGYNYRLPNINAALGCAQLERLTEFVAAKRALAARYVDAFQEVEGASIFTDQPHCESNYWLVTMMLDRPDDALRDEFLEACHARGILSRPVWTGMHRLPMFENCPRDDLRQMEALEGRIINLPSSPILAMGAFRPAVS